MQLTDGRSECTETKSGIQQSLPLDDIIKTVKRKEQTANALAFADDVMISGELETEVQAKLYL